jgi:hypothetical protein
MKNIFYILLLLPTIIFAQYPNNSGHKITLGEQTTADGLIYRGVASIDTLTATNKITRANKQDTSAFILLDTVTNLLWHYKTASNGWSQAGGSTLDTATMLLPYYRSGRTGIIQASDVPTLNQNTTGSAATLTTSRTFQTNLASTSTASFNGSANVTPGVTGTLPVANGGTNRTTMPAGYILHGDGTSVDTAIGLFWDRSLRFLGVGTTSPALDITINSSSSVPGMAFTQSYKNTSDQRGGFYWLNYLNSTVSSIVAQAQGDSVGTGLEFSTRPVAGLNTVNMVLRETGRLGIGTVSPTEKLHVVGNGLFTNKISVGGSTGVSLLANPAANGYGGFWHNSVIPASTNYAMQTNGETVLINGSTAVTIAHGGSGKLSIRSFGADVVGDFGIGITPPTSRLHVKGVTNTSGESSLNVTNSSDASLLFVRNDGNVGIGTTSPQVKLEIAQNTDNTDGPTLRIANNANTLSNGQLIGAIDFYNGDDSGTGDAVGAYIRSYTADATLPVGSQYLSLAAGGSTERMRITSAGNVGIGTTTPSYLVTSSSSNGNAFMYSAESNSIGTVGNWVGYLYGYKGNTYQKGATIFESIDANGRGKFHIALNNATNSSNVSISDAKLTVLPDGNVGIGTTTPTFKLDVNGTGRFSGALSGTSATFSADVTSIGASQNLFIADGTTYSGLKLNRAGVAKWAIFNNNAGTDFLDFYWYGSSPGTKFKIEPTGAATFSSSVTANRYIIYGSNGNAGQIIQQGDLLGSPGTNLLLQSNTGNAIGFLTNGGTTFNMFINTSGNVGIGTTSPAAILDVRSTMRVSGDGINFGSSANDVTLSSIVYTNGTGGIDVKSLAKLGLYSAGTERIHITTGGNVGISRTPTTNALEVNGDASKTTIGSWAANSDSTIKTEIHTIDSALDRINKVRLVSFKYKDEYKLLNPSIKDKFYQSVIAQEFQKIYPDYVYESGDIFEGKNILQVDTNPMYIDAISSIQELSILVKELSAQVDILKQEIINLKNK